MKGFTDEIAATGQHLDDQDTICYILVGHDFEFNPFVEAFTAKLRTRCSMTFTPSCSLRRLEWSLRRSTNTSVLMLPIVVAKGAVVPCMATVTAVYVADEEEVVAVVVVVATNKIPCQVYSKTRHFALRCYMCFDASYNSAEKHANAATSSYNADTD
jgi:hypothetical protein